MQNVGSLKIVSKITLVLTGLGLGACNLIATPVAGSSGAGDNGAVSPVISATALTAVSSSLQTQINQYDASCSSHANAVQVAYEQQIDGRNLTAAEVLAIFNAVPDQSSGAVCRAQLMQLADSIAANVAFRPRSESFEAVVAQATALLFPEARAADSVSIRMARLLRVVYTIHVAEDLHLGSVAAKAGFELSQSVVQRDLNVAAIPALPVNAYQH